MVFFAMKGRILKAYIRDLPVACPAGGSNNVGSERYAQCAIVICVPEKKGKLVPDAVHRDIAGFAEVGSEINYPVIIIVKVPVP
jgi:hypothetical protein